MVEMDNNKEQLSQGRQNDQVRSDDTNDVAEKKIISNKSSNKQKKMLPWYMIMIPVTALLVIVFAFIMEARGNNKPDSDESAASEHSASGVQAEINKQNWIVQDLLPINDFSRPGTKLETVNGIVIHNIGNPGTTAVQNRNYFANLANTQERHASSNFIICLDGTIIQCVPVDEIAYASNIRNPDTLSIEVCHPDDTGKFTDESYSAAIKLTAWLCEKYRLTSNDVIRHFDVQGKECPRYFVENEIAWDLFNAEVAVAISQMR